MNVVHEPPSRKRTPVTNVNMVYVVTGMGHGYNSGAISAAFGNRPKMPPVWTKTIRSP